MRQLWENLHSTFREQFAYLVVIQTPFVGQSGAGENKAPLINRRMDGTSVIPTPCLYPMADQAGHFGPCERCDRGADFGQRFTEKVHSMALFTAGRIRCEWGFLAFGHADPQHYQPGMDSLPLEQLGRFVTQLLPTFAFL